MQNFWAWNPSEHMLKTGRAAWKGNYYYYYYYASLTSCSISVCCVAPSGVPSAYLCSMCHREALELRPATMCRQLGVINAGLSVRSHMQQLVPLCGVFYICFVLIEPVPVVQWRAPPCVKSAATAAAEPRRSCSQRQLLFMQSASAERTVGLLCVLRHPSARGQHHQKRGESVETLFLLPFSTRICWKTMIWSAIFAVRRHHETEEGRKACREYRWEQLLTPPSRWSAARLDKAEGTSAWGFWYSSVF